MKRIIVAIIFGAIVAAGLSFFAAGQAGSSISKDESMVIPTIQTNEGGQSFSLKATGDIMLARKVGRYIASQGTDYPIKFMADYLRDADMTIGNLESPIADTGKAIPGKGICFRAAPETVDSLSSAGFDMVTLANNHAVDYDSPALLQTIEILDAAGIKNFGAGKNLADAREAQLIETNGVKVAYLGYSEMGDIFWDYSYKRMFAAESNLAGIAPLKEKTVLADIEKAKEAGADVIILNLHWGVEYKHNPETYQRELAHKFIDAGADIIVGHHPHCIQGVETYNQGLIMYSLGNFIFDQDFSTQTRQGLVLEAEITPLGWKSAAFAPIMITEGQPTLATGEEQQAIFDLLQESSKNFGTKFEIKDGKIYVLGGK